MNRNKAISLTVGALLLGPVAAVHAAEIATSNSPSADGAAAPRIPSLDDMAGEWIPMKDVANPPAVHNFLEMLIIGYDLTSFSFSPGTAVYLWHNQPETKIYPQIKLRVGGKAYSAAECRGYPYRALRRNLDCAGLAVKTDIRPINEQNAVLCRVQVSNPGTTDRTTTLSLEVPGHLHADKLTALNNFQNDNDSSYKNRSFVTAIEPLPRPGSTSETNGMVRWTWAMTIPPGGTQIVEFVAGHGERKDTEQVVARVADWSRNFTTEFDGFKKCWEQRWADAFTPGNKHFSGNLPVLAADNAALKRNYYMGVYTLLALERTQFPLHPRCFITNGERAPGLTFLWDPSEQATVWALLEPEGMKAALRRFLIHSPRGSAVDSFTETRGCDKRPRDKIEGYAFNACAIFKTADDYLRVTADVAFLDEKLENGKTVLEQLDALATDWETLPKGPLGLVSYGENDNLLECAPDYIHCVPSLHAQEVWMMRRAAQWHALHGAANRAKELRDKASRLLPVVLSLYKPGDGVWYGLHMDGKRVEFRHCVDYIYIGNALANDLSPIMRKEMTEFVKRELYQRDWMRAMSLQDQAAARSDRPDHGPWGAYDGWVPMSVGAMWRLGFPQDAFDFYCRTAVVTKEGPFQQAREFYGPDRAAYNSPVRVAYRGGCCKESIDGAAFTDVVINAFFGFTPLPDSASLLCDPQTPRPFQGTLTGLRYRGQLYQLTASARGVKITGDQRIEQP